MQLADKTEFARQVCLFLAESLRLNRLDPAQASEIARQVVVHYNLLDTERDWLNLVKDLAGDHEPLAELERRLGLRMETDRRKQEERIIRQYAARLLVDGSPEQALSFLEEAASADFQSLCQKYPELVNPN